MTLENRRTALGACQRDHEIWSGFRHRYRGYEPHTADERYRDRETLHIHRLMINTIERALPCRDAQRTKLTGAERTARERRRRAVRLSERLGVSHLTL